MNTSKKLLAIGLTAFTLMCVTVVAFSSGSLSNSLTNNSIYQGNAVVNVATPYSLILDESWGYNGETTKVKRSIGDNNFTIGFSDGTKFGGSGEGLAFTTTQNGLYIYNSTILNGVTQVYVTGSSTNDNATVTIYSHNDSQTYCQIDENSQRTIGSLNSLIGFEPAKYIAIRFEGIDNITSVEIGYSCSAPIDYKFNMKGGGQNTDLNGLFQSMTGISTEYAAGTEVHVQMDVNVTGTFDSESCEVYWVDAVWSVDGGESDKSRTSIKPLVTSEADWHTIEFDATVRNFSNLRFNTKYNKTSMSEFGNAVYLIAVTHETLQSFDYRNVTITKQYETMIDHGTKGTAYHQTLGVLESSLAVGTSVYVEMDVIRTGTFDKWSSVGWVNGIDAANAATRVSIKTEFGIASDSAWTENDWQHVSFVATIRNFDVLRKDADYSLIDTSSFGNGVYLLTENNDSRSFNYKNVEITRIESMTPCGDNNNANDKYYQNVVGLSTDLDVGANVTAEMDVYITGTFNSYSGIYWINTVYGNNLWNNAPSIKTGDQTASMKDGEWHHISFEATVRNFSSCGRWVAADTSSYGNAVYLISCQKTSDAFNYKNVVITAV